MYDYLVVGSGLYGAVFAHEAKKTGKTVLVVDKRSNIAGNIYTENMDVLMFMSTAHISSTLTTQRSGNISRSLLSSTGSPTVQLLIIRVNCIACLSICTPLIRCGAW